MVSGRCGPYRWSNAGHWSRMVQPRGAWRVEIGGHWNQNRLRSQAVSLITHGQSPLSAAESHTEAETSMQQPRLGLIGWGAIGKRGGPAHKCRLGCQCATTVFGTATYVGSMSLRAVQHRPPRPRLCGRRRGRGRHRPAGPTSSAERTNGPRQEISPSLWLDCPSIE